jgi:HK97 family phage major capsid protein
VNSIEAKRAQLARESEDISTLITRAIATKNYSKLDGLEHRVTALADARKAFERQQSVPAWATGAANSGPAPSYNTKAVTGGQLSPLNFSDESLGAMYKAFNARQPMSIESKGYSTIESLLPAELDPQVVAKIHENRLLERIPAIAISAPSYEFIVHNFASDSGGPSAVAEGGSKPEYIPAASSSIVSAVKLAMNTGISYESLSDWPQWQSYVYTECFKQITDLENTQLLSGSGSGGNILGFLSTSGILTHNCSSDPGTYTAIDSIEASITQLRVASALAEANLLVLHPTCWAAIRRIKTTTNSYVAGDPMREAISSIWGVPVLITTAITNGVGLLLDTTKFGNALIREGIRMHQGFSGTDFVENICRYVFEERIALAVERPQAVLSISNLPTS